MVFEGLAAIGVIVLLALAGFALVALPCVGLAKWCKKRGLPSDFI